MMLTSSLSSGTALAAPGAPPQELANLQARRALADEADTVTATAAAAAGTAADDCNERSVKDSETGECKACPDYQRAVKGEGTQSCVASTCADP